MNKIKKGIIGELLFLVLLIAILSCKNNITSILTTSQSNTVTESNPFSKRDKEPMTKKDYIKWVEFNVTSKALNTAYKYDVESYNTDIKINWIELLAYAACKGGGNVGKNAVSEMKKAAESIKSGETTMEDLTKDLKHYSYYLEAYSAILDGFVGEYEIEEDDGTETGNKVWVKKYGLKAFSPIAKGFPYSDYDDFGVSRSYGYKRNHLGHDMMGQIGTPFFINIYSKIASNASGLVFLFYKILILIFTYISKNVLTSTLYRVIINIS